VRRQQDSPSGLFRCTYRHGGQQFSNDVFVDAIESFLVASACMLTLTPKIKTIGTFLYVCLKVIGSDRQKFRHAQRTQNPISITMGFFGKKKQQGVYIRAYKEPLK
jgi:hypothetical protein